MHIKTKTEETPKGHLVDTCMEKNLPLSKLNFCMLQPSINAKMKYNPKSSYSYSMDFHIRPTLNTIFDVLRCGFIKVHRVDFA